MPTEPDVLNPWPRGKKLLFPRVDGVRLKLHHVEARSIWRSGHSPSLSLPLIFQRWKKKPM